MFYEQDNFAPCTDPEKCTPENYKPNHPVRDTHSDPRTLEAKEKPWNLDDDYKNCSDPNNPEYYRAECDPERSMHPTPPPPSQRVCLCARTCTGNVCAVPS